MGGRGVISGHWFACLSLQKLPARCLSCGSIAQTRICAPRLTGAAATASSTDLRTITGTRARCCDSHPDCQGITQREGPCPRCPSPCQEPAGRGSNPAGQSSSAAGCVPWSPLPACCPAGRGLSLLAWLGLWAWVDQKESAPAFPCRCRLEPWCDTTGSQTNLPAADVHSCILPPMRLHPSARAAAAVCFPKPPPQTLSMPASCLAKTRSQLGAAPGRPPGESGAAPHFGLSGGMFSTSLRDGLRRWVNFPLLQRSMFKEKKSLLSWFNSFTTGFLWFGECTY